MPKDGPNDQARARTRAALLQAGVELLVESARRNPFGDTTVQAICERAGYSTGAIYQHWPSVAEYYDEVAGFLAADDDAFAGDMANLAELGKACAADSTFTAIARVADRDLQLLAANRLYDAQELLSVTWGRTRFREQMARGYRVDGHDIGQVYGTILAERGREPRPPLDWDRIGAILQALIEGATMRHKIDPEAGVLSSESDLGSYATAVAAVLAVVTRPVGDDADFGETAEALLEGRVRPGAESAATGNGSRLPADGQR
jgi:AcrR family transcriptional regulator